MDLPQYDTKSDYLQNLTIPSAFIDYSLGESLKKAIDKKDFVLVNLDWSEALPHPDERVEYEFWTNSNFECGPECDNQINFVKSFKGFAQTLEQKGHTQFTPHYITWYCPEEYISTTKCKSQCINHGKYCAPDPDGDFSNGYTGRQVVVQNLIQACFYKAANESGKSWLWWDYVTDFDTHCSMKEYKYNEDCAHEVIKSLGFDIKKIDECVGNPEENAENAVLKSEQEAQIGKGDRGDVTIQPTLVINNRQYRGKLDKRAVLKAICSGFEETTEPALCLSNDIETNECMHNNGGCWMDTTTNITACKLHQLYVVKLTTEAVGMARKRAGTTLLVLMAIKMVARVRQDLKETELLVVKILMNAKRKRHVNVPNANARIRGEVTSVAALATQSTSKNMTHV